MKRRSTYQRPKHGLSWTNPIVFFLLLMSFGSIAMALGLRLTGLLP